MINVVGLRNWYITDVQRGYLEKEIYGLSARCVIVDAGKY